MDCAGLKAETVMVEDVMLVSITDAKKRLDELIDLAISGEEIIITRRGKPVGKLRAFRQVQMIQDASEEFLAELDRSVRDYDR